MKPTIIYDLRELTKSVETRLFAGASEFAGENLGTLLMN